MSSVSTLIKRLFIRNLLWAATLANSTVLAILQAFAVASITRVTSGKTIIRTTANGHDTTFEVNQDASTTDISEMISEVLDRYDEAKDHLIHCGSPTPTDAQIISEMLHTTKPVQSSGNDFRDLRMEPETRGWLV